MNRIAPQLIGWYHRHKRDLPWRATSDPYYIWLSEIILQQTRVDQGLAYYHRFVTNFPTVASLAKADEEEVLKLWQGLGYYSRARNLHASAKYIYKELKGRFPETYREIIGLKGVGAYTAAAIASFAFGEPKAAVDGNVYRVLSRVFGIKTPIDSAKGKKQFQELADKLIDAERPGDFNQAIMELGATLCKPVKPACDTCPLEAMCYAREKKAVGRLPVKEKKTKTRDRYFNYLVLHHRGALILRKRTGKDIWKNLYDFPLIESTAELEFGKLSRDKGWKGLLGRTRYQLGRVSALHKHVLSHQRIFARFWEIELKAPLIKPGPGSIWVKRKDVGQYAVPRLVDRYLCSDL